MKTRRKLIYLAIILMLVVILSSCVSKVEKDQTQYFQALAEDGAFVITSTKDALVENGVDLGLNNIIENKLDRVSISLYDGNFYAGLEGRFSSFLVNSALLVAKDYKKEGNYYKNVDNTLQLYSPKRNLLLISSNEFDEARKKTVEDRIINIDDTTAALMTAADLAIYSNNPTSLKELGYDIDDSVALSMENLLIYYKDNLVYLTATFKTEKAANSFSIAMRASYVTDLKKRNAKVDIQKLKQIFLYEGLTVNIKGIEMSKAKVEDINTIIKKFI